MTGFLLKVPLWATVSLGLAIIICEIWRRHFNDKFLREQLEDLLDIALGKSLLGGVWGVNFIIGVIIAIHHWMIGLFLILIALIPQLNIIPVLFPPSVIAFLLEFGGYLILDDFRDIS